MQKTKLLFLMNTLNGGGAEKVLVDLVNHLDPERYDITVQTVIDSGIYRSQLQSHIRYKTIYPGNKLFSYFFSKFLCARLNAKRFYEKYIKDDYDVEVAFLEGFPTKILAASPTCRKFAWVHTDLYHYYGHKTLFRSMEENRQCYLNYTRIVCVSQTAKEGFIRQFGEMENVVVQYNPVDEQTILAKSKEPLVDFVTNREQLRLISVGRLVPQKGYDRLLRVHHKLIAEGFLHTLWIVGEGGEREMLERYIRQNRLEDTVTLLGFQSNPYQYMNAADLFVCSSRAEGYSTVVTEALVCGIAVISTECSGAQELLGDSEYGAIVENEEEALYQGLKKLISSPDLLEHYKNKAQERGKHFVLANKIKEIEKIFEWDV